MRLVHKNRTGQPWVKPAHDEQSVPSQYPIALLHLLRIQINLSAHLLELLRHLRHARLREGLRLRRGYGGRVGGQTVLKYARHRHAHARRIVQRRGVIADVLRDLHRAEFRAAHRAEMRPLVRFLRQRLVVEALRGVGIEPEVELVHPAEVEPRPRQRVVAQLRGGVAFGEIAGVRRDLVGDDAGLDVVTVGQAEMLLRRHVTQYGAAEPADHGGTYSGGDVVVARRDVGGQRPQRIERRLAAFLELLVHVDLYLVHRHMAGALDHHLAALVPRDLRQLAERLQLGELRAVVGVRDRAGTQAVAERERHIIFAHQVADLVESCVEETLLVMRQAPLRHDRATSRDDAGDAVGGQVDVGQPHAGVDGEVIDALFALLDQRVLVDLPVEFYGIAVDLLQRLVDRNGPDRDRRVAKNPFAGGVDVAPGRKVHHGVGAPADRPHHLVDFFLHRRRHRGVADIGVDLGEKIAADDHRLELAMVDVAGNDRASPRDLGAHEFRRDEGGDVGAKTFAVGERGFRAFVLNFAA